VSWTPAVTCHACALARLRFVALVRPHRSMCTAMKRPAMYSSASRRRLHRLRSAGLMFTICNVLYASIPAGPAIAARVPLVRSWAAPASCNDRRSQGPGARRGSVYLRRAKPYCQVSWHPVLRDLRKDTGFPCGQPVRHVRSHPANVEYFQ